VNFVLVKVSLISSIDWVKSGLLLPNPRRMVSPWLIKLKLESTKKPHRLVNWIGLLFFTPGQKMQCADGGIVPGLDQIVRPVVDDLVKVVNIFVQVVDDIVYGRGLIEKHTTGAEEKLDVKVVRREIPVNLFCHLLFVA